MWKWVDIQVSLAVPKIAFSGPFLINKKKIKEHVSEIETSPVSIITLVLRKIDLHQADCSIFLEVNHPGFSMVIQSSSLKPVVLGTNSTHRVYIVSGIGYHSKFSKFSQFSQFPSAGFLSFLSFLYIMWCDDHGCHSNTLTCYCLYLKIGTGPNPNPLLASKMPSW